MRLNRLTLLLAILCVFSVQNSFSQSLWNDSSSPDKGSPTITPSEYRTLGLDFDGMKDLLDEAPKEEDTNLRFSNSIIELPLPNGATQSFRFVESSIMEPELQKKFPEIRSYIGQAVDNSTVVVRFGISHKGFHAMIRGRAEGSIYIDSYSMGDTDNYIAYTKKAFYETCDKTFDELPPQMSPEFEIDTEKYDEAVSTKPRTQKSPRTQVMGMRTSSGSELRTYRLALACTGEYATFHGGTVPDVLAAYNVSMTRVNGVYETDVAIRMVLVANTDQIVYLDGGTDPYTNGNGGAMLGQNQTTCDNVIGSANYDIGHVFSTGGGGVAFLQSPCGGNKAGGVTGQGAPVGDPFDIDYVCHEMGHQFGGNHTQNNPCNRSGGAAFEPGSASTIMGYAGICAPNLQSNSDDHFHNHSYNEIISFSVNGNGNNCAVVTATGNTPPTVDAGAGGWNIPASTPFELSAVASDGDGDLLMYNWEQYDLGPATAGGDNDLTNPSGNQPIFRSWPSEISETRVFPRIPDLVNNTVTIGEHLPTYTRSLQFKCTVRDMVPAGGGVADDLVQFDVDGNSGPFVVTSPNTGVAYPGNSIQTVTWDVAGTDGAPVNATNVDVYLSVDGGYTWPFLLLTGTANDGSADVLIPDSETSMARIKVKGSGNIFFDISNQNFTILPSIGDIDNDAALTGIASPVGDYCSDQVTPEFTITNLGLNTLTSLTINWDIDGGTNNVINWTGSLASGSSEVVTAGVQTVAGGSHTFNVSLENPNGVADENMTNDSASSSFTTVTGGNLSTLTFTTDCWGEEVSWTLSQDDGTIIDQVAANTLADQTTYTWEFCLSVDCYEWEVLDSFGDGQDGIPSGCSTNGNYFMEDNQGNTLFQMGDPNYGSGTTETFCITATGTPGCTDDTACNYNMDATIDDGSCTFPGCTNMTACNYDASAGCDDGSCVLPDGCTDMTACNYDATATCDDGSCILPDGCTDMSACNYDASASCDDGSCILPDGCTDMTACNYDATATCDDGSCILPDGCTDMSACNYDASAVCDDSSCILPDGCTDNTACNYDASANCDDGSCILPDGCTDMTACNYDASALCDDGSCILPDGCTDMSACNYDAAAVCDDGSCVLPDGCTDMTACNYDATATCDDGSCILPDGCTTAGACNYDPTALCDDGSCEFGSCTGCTDPNACNYDMNATIDDGSCLLPDGCTDMTACNFDASATCDDGSCILPNGCTDMNACNYDASATCDDGSCILPNGCTDMTACNYDASATCDDGSCILPDGCTDMSACNYDASATCDDGSCILPDGCTDMSACNYDASATCDDGSCILPNGCTDMTACNYDASATCDDGSCILPDGCTDMTACNYDASASCDDGSCILPDGCTDMTACNYDASATCDDGSCEYPMNVFYLDADLDGFGDINETAMSCDMTPPSGYVADNTDCDDDDDSMYPGAPGTMEGKDNDCNGTVEGDEVAPCVGDFNSDGSVNVADLLILLAEFGCTGTCTADINNDGAVNAADTLTFLAAYGSECP